VITHGKDQITSRDVSRSFSTQVDQNELKNAFRPSKYIITVFYSLAPPPHLSLCRFIHGDIFYVIISVTILNFCESRRFNFNQFFTTLGLPQSVYHTRYFTTLGKIVFFF